MFPFGSLDFCGAILVWWRDAGGPGVWVDTCNPLRISDLSLDSDLWWLCHQDSDMTAVRNPGLLVRRVG